MVFLEHFPLCIFARTWQRNDHQHVQHVTVPPTEYASIIQQKFREFGQQICIYASVDHKHILMYRLGLDQMEGDISEGR